MNPGAALLLLLGVVLLPGSAAAVRVTGRVTDRAGRPLELVTVAARAQHAAAVSDERGAFELELPPGPATLEASQIGYERAKLEIRVAEGMAPLHFALADQPVELSEVTVAASSFGKTGRGEGPVLSRRDVVMTPGGAADVFQSLRALPGINAPAEGAAVYVRGGSPDESLIRLDGADIGHPYHYERASGGLFSSLDTYLIESAFFSSGGYGARYGNALSGVLDIQTLDPKDLRTVSFGANLAGLGGSATWALLPGRLSLMTSLRLGAPGLLLRLYGSSRDYETAPISRDGAARLLYRYSPTGRLALTWLGAGDAVRLRSRFLNLQERYEDGTATHFAGLRLDDVVAGALAVHAQVAGQLYRTDWSYGVMDAGQRERNVRASFDAVWPLAPRHELSFGASWTRHDTRIAGIFPADSTDLSAGAPVRRFDGHPVRDEPGVYAEDKLRVWGPLYATLGARADRLSAARDWSFDPRAALAWRLDEHQTVRIAGGVYHEEPPASDLDPVYGNPRLRPLVARHAIAGYEWKSEFGDVRLEAYRKDYRDLVTNQAATFYGNGGFGYARGVDAFVQGTWRWLSGWVSYGYLDTRRKERDDPRELPSPWGVRHTLSLVGMYQLSGRWQLGSRWAWSSGRPYTPVVGRTWDPTRGQWRPVLGENDSALLPDYERLDVRLTRLFGLPAALGGRSAPCAFYVEGMNVLGTRNVLEYDWDATFTTRIAQDSYFARRLLVAGVALTW